MKKTINFIAATMFAAGAMLCGCSSPSEKVENAQTKVDDANQNLNQAQDDYAADVQSFRTAEDAKYAANQKSIADFNARIENQKQDARDDYKKKIAALDQKNTDMKKRMDD